MRNQCYISRDRLITGGMTKDVDFGSYGDFLLGKYIEIAFFCVLEVATDQIFFLLGKILNLNFFFGCRY